MAVKQIYVKAGDEDLWARAQAACKRKDVALSVVLADFLRHWLNRVGEEQSWLLATSNKTPEALIETIEAKLADLKSQVADLQERASA